MAETSFALQWLDIISKNGQHRSKEQNNKSE